MICGLLQGIAVHVISITVKSGRMDVEIAQHIKDIHPRLEMPHREIIYGKKNYSQK